MKNASIHQLPLLASALGAGLLLMGCSDPASDVHRSDASTPEELVQATPGTVGKIYSIRPESKIDFVGSKVTGSHDGGFTNFSGTIPVADGKVISGAVITIDMNSLWSDNDRLTGHLRSADFFDVENHPKATFTVTKVETGEVNSLVTGNLSLHGETKSITFPATVEVSEDTVVVQADFAINRKDFNINYPGRPDDLIRDNVVIKLNVTAAPAG